MKKRVQGDMVFDTGVFVEILAGTDLGRNLMEGLISERLRAITTDLNIAELNYVICRKVGWERSYEIVSKLLSSGYVEVRRAGDFAERAARMKCERSLSLVDCFTISAGESLGISVLFARREGELERELARKPFGVEILFAEDLF